MMPLWLIRFGNGVRRGSGISTTCYPAPAAIHGSLSSDKERLKLCLRVQTPAPILGRTSRNRSGHPGCADGASPRGGDRSPTPQPPTSSNRCGSRRTHPNPVVGTTPLRSLGARSILETAPCRWLPFPTPIPQHAVWAAESNSHPLHYLGRNALFCRHIPTQGSILLLCLAFMTTQWLGCMAASGDMSSSCHASQPKNIRRSFQDVPPLTK